MIMIRLEMTVSSNFEMMTSMIVSLKILTTFVYVILSMIAALLEHTLSFPSHKRILTSLRQKAFFHIVSNFIIKSCLCHAVNA